MKISLLRRVVIVVIAVGTAGVAAARLMISQEQSHAPAIVSDDDQAREKKLAPYIRCFNSVDGPLRDAAKSYLKRAVKQTAPDASMPYQPPAAFEIDAYAGDTSHSAACINDLAESISALPAMPQLDARGRTYSNELRGLLPAISQSNTYYAQENDKDDNFGQARKLRATLAVGFKRLFHDADRLRSLVEVESRTLKRHELAGIEKTEGRSLRWHALDAMIAARALFDAVNTPRLTARAIDGPLDVYAATYRDAITYAEAHPKEAILPDGSTDMSRDGGWSGIKFPGKRYLADAKEIRRIVTSAPKSSAALQTAEQSFVSAFNALTVNYNVTMNTLSTNP